MRAALALALVLAAGGVQAAGAPHSPYPERYPPPDDAAERAARCEAYRERLERTRDRMKAEGFLSRLNWLVSRHRRTERFLYEHCGAERARVPIVPAEARGASGHDGASH